MTVRIGHHIALNQPTIRFGSGLLLMSVASTCMAQEPDQSNPFESLPLEQLLKVKVNTVSRIAENIDDTPGSVYLFPKEVIWRRGYQSLAELLRAVPGFSVFHRDLNYVAGVRGLNANDNEKISLLINGQNFGGGFEPDFLNGPINLDNVDRVEVVVGPSSLFQPANTLAATINIITPKDAGGKITGHLGTSRYGSLSFRQGEQESEQRYWSASASVSSLQGFNAWQGTLRPNLTGSNDTGAISSPSFFAVLDGQRDGWKAQFTGHRVQHPELNIAANAAGNRGSYVDEFYSLSMSAERTIGHGLVQSLTATSTLKNVARMSTSDVTPDSLDIATRQWVNTFEWSFRHDDGGHHTLQFGLQSAYEKNLDSFYRTSDGNGIYSAPVTLVDRDTKSIGFFADDIFRPGPAWQLVFGARVDQSTRVQGSRWFPGFRAGAVYRASTNWTSKLLVNQAVRMPSAVAGVDAAWGAGKVGAPSWATLVDPPRDPEVLTTTEWQNIFHYRGARIGTTIYHQSLKDYISWIGPWTNVGDFSGNGFELSVAAPITRLASFWLSGAYNDSRLTPFSQFQTSGGDTENHHLAVDLDNRILASPMWMVTTGVDLALSPTLALSPSIRWFTHQRGYEASSSQFVTINNRTYLDASLVWKSSWGGNPIDVRLAGTNLLNNQASIAAQWMKDLYVPQGREFSLTVAVRF